MNIEIASKVNELIIDECTRFDLSEVCNHYGITTDDFYEFLNIAMMNIKTSKRNNDE